MPALRFLNERGEWLEVILTRDPQGDGCCPPLLIGPEPEAEGYLHLPGAGPASLRLERVGLAGSISYVVLGREIRVNHGTAPFLRVLRHGDRVQTGSAELLYLDFSPHEAGHTVGQPCAARGCGEAVEAGDDVTECPGCGRMYHFACWLGLHQCDRTECYPVRRVLLAELTGRVRVDRLTMPPERAAPLCAAQCENMGSLKEGAEIIRCLNPDCLAVYHPGCWFPRKECLLCRTSISSLVDRVVLRRTEGQRR